MNSYFNNLVNGNNTQVKSANQEQIENTLDALKQAIADMDLTPAARKNATDVITLLSEERYASTTLFQRLALGSKGEIGLTLSESDFFGQNPGFFQLRGAWPERDEADILKLKLTINYMVEKGENVLLQPGMGTGDSMGWANINSAPVPVQQLIEHGFIDPNAFGQLLDFCQSKLDITEKATLPLTPKSDVIVTLRATVVPLNSTGTIGKREIVSKRAAGELANLGINTISFSGATVLAALSPLVIDGPRNATLGMAELMAKYSGRPVATPENVLNNAANM